MQGGAWRLLETEAATLGVGIGPRQFDQFRLLQGEIQRFSLRFSLTGLRSEDEIVAHHFLDSLACLAAVRPEAGERVIDVGSGAGFPGLPVKIVRPDLRLCLLEANRRRALFLEHVRRTIGLEEVEVLWGRAEEWAHRAGYREAFGLAVARGVAALATTAEWCLPFLRLGGRLVAYRGPEAWQEAAGAAAALEGLGGRLERLVRRPFERWGRGRVLVVVCKEAPTPGRYPRRVARWGGRRRDRGTQPRAAN
ncbi:MAG: 16S rRNA (guanine(527)-N(7))-methyltransferase RsmG [Acetobacteraceae bacterium]|nr:16S rRNA (guanine(527)-N(7))-methyltransferase RsmG [Acetobacteraceae bacterium]